MPEGINELKVVAWLREHVPVLEGNVSFSLIAGGHSNLTFKFRLCGDDFRLTEQFETWFSQKWGLCCLPRAVQWNFRREP